MKARGRGFSLDPSCFDVLGAPGHVRSAPGRPPRPAAGSGEDPAELQRWVLHDIPSSPGFSAAFAVEGRSVRLSRVGETVFRGWIE